MTKILLILTLLTLSACGAPFTSSDVLAGTGEAGEAPLGAAGTPSAADAGSAGLMSVGAAGAAGGTTGEAGFGGALPTAARAKRGRRARGQRALRRWREFLAVRQSIQPPQGFCRSVATPVTARRKPSTRSPAGDLPGISGRSRSMAPWPSATRCRSSRLRSTATITSISKARLRVPTGCAGLRQARPRRAGRSGLTTNARNTKSATSSRITATTGSVTLPSARCAPRMGVAPRAASVRMETCGWMRARAGDRLRAVRQGQTRARLRGQEGPARACLRRVPLAVQAGQLRHPRQ